MGEEKAVKVSVVSMENGASLPRSPSVGTTLSDRLETPLIQVREHGTVSNTWTLMNILKGMIGPGCLALPVAFKYCGLWAGLVLIFIIGFINTHCMAMLVHAAHFLCDKSGKMELDYGHLAKKAFDYGPEKLQPHSKKALYATNTVICLLQIGICSVLFVFMAAHLQEVLGSYKSSLGLMDVRLYLCFVLLPVILLNYIRELWILAYLSTLANLLMLVSFAIILYSLLVSSNHVSDLPSVTTNFGPFVSGIGSMLYAFEGQAMILPMENKMKTPEVMVGWNGILSTGMAITTCIYAATGFFGYASYGVDVKGSVAQSFPNTPLFISVKLMLVASVFIGYGIQMYIVIEMLWPAIQRKLPTALQDYSLLVECIFRLVLVVVTFLIAVGVPNLENIIPLVGISAGMILALVIPPFLEMVSFWEVWTVNYSAEPWKKNVLIAKNSTLVVTGVLGVVIGLLSTIVKLANNDNE